MLGVLVISGEYSTGMIRSTFAAVPKRLPVLWAKGRRLRPRHARARSSVDADRVLRCAGDPQGHSLNGHDIALSFSDPGVARAVIGGALYLTLVGLFGLGLGAILRNTAGGISAFAGILFVLPPLMNVLPASWNNAISPYLPSNAGQAIMQTGNPAHTLAPWTGLGVFAAYTAVAIAIAAIQLRRRDV